MSVYYGRAPPFGLSSCDFCLNNAAFSQLITLLAMNGSFRLLGQTLKQEISYRK